VLIFCDLTIDAPVVLSAEDEKESQLRKNKFRDYSERLDALTKELQDLISKPKNNVTKEELDDLYSKIRAVDTVDFQKM